MFMHKLAHWTADYYLCVLDLHVCTSMHTHTKLPKCMHKNTFVYVHMDAHVNTHTPSIHLTNLS